MFNEKIKKSDFKFAILIFSIAVLFSLFFIYSKPELTGLVVYEQASYEWDFSSSSDYSFNSDEVIFENNQVKLKSTTTLKNNTIIELRTAVLEEATYKGGDKLSKLNSIDGEKVNVKEDEKLNIKLNNSLNNSDKINLYIIDANKNRTIHICNYDETCNSPGYGSLDYNPTELGVSNLQPNNYETAELEEGDEYYLDRSYTITDQPDDFEDYVAIKTNNDDKYNSDDVFITFDANKDTIVYIAYDSRATTLPTWMSDYTDTGNNVETTDVTLNLYSKTHNSGTITLGGNHNGGNTGANSNYIVYVADNEDNDGTYTITLSGLASSQDDFRIKTSDKVKIDYIDATYLFLEFNETEITTYPDSSSIETNDLSLGVVGQATVVIDYSGNISFEFSLDSGSNWESTEDNSSINLAGGNNIRFKSTLNYNESSLPTLNKITLDYNVCNENWECDGWGECSKFSEKNRTCSDLNECGTTTNKPIEEASCVYFTNYYKINKSELLAIKKNTLTKLNGSRAAIDLMIKNDLNNTNITLREYNKSSKNITGLKQLGRFLDISADDEVNQNINYSVIMLYYTDEDLATNNLNEDTLKLHYYNETSGEWEELSSSVNKEENYVYATVYHFSTYGIFGDENQGDGSSSSGGGSGGGSSSSRKRSRSSNVIIKEQIEEQPKEEEPVEVVEEVETGEVIEVEEEQKKGIFSFFTGKAIYVGKNLKEFYKDNIIFFIALLSLIVLYFVFRIIYLRKN